MIYLGAGKRVIRPFGYMQGASGKIDITSFTVTHSVGVLSVARVGVIPDFFNKINLQQQTRELYKVYIGDKGSDAFHVFSGYPMAADPRLVSGQLSFQVNFIHQARDLDQTSIFNPDLHPGSMNDMSWTISRGDSLLNQGTSADVNLDSTGWYNAADTRPLPVQVIDKLLKELDKIQAVTSGPNYTEEIQNLTITKQLLQKIAFENPIYGVLTLPPNIVLNTQKAINRIIHNDIHGSISGNRSIWDVLSRLFARFGDIQFICRPNDIVITPNVSGMKPPESNTIISEHIDQVGQTIALSRNISKCYVFSTNVTPMYLGNAPSKSVVGVYPAKGARQSGGSTLVVAAPTWLFPEKVVSSMETKNVAGDQSAISWNAVNQSHDAVKKYEKCADTIQKLIPDGQAALNAYAKRQYHLERDRAKTLTISGPMAPNVFPGTMCRVDVDMVFKSLQGGEAPSVTKKTYYGYCYQVQHIVDVAAKTAQTNFFLSHVTDDANSLLQTCPLFSDTKPLEWE